MKARVVFKNPCSGNIAVRYGTLKSENTFNNASSLTVEVADAKLSTGGKATVVSVGKISFFLRDVNSKYPIFLPFFGAAVLPADDMRSYEEIECAVKANGELTERERWNIEPEETLENAEKSTREQITPTWVGLGLDVRGFWLDYNDHRNAKLKELNALDFRTWGYIRPSQLYWGTRPNGCQEPYHLHFGMGPGPHCSPKIERHIEDDVLPILHSTQHDGAIDYQLTAFATLENHTLSEAAVKGTPENIAYSFGGYPGQVRLSADEIHRLRNSLNRDEEVVLMLRIRAYNTSKTPAYAFLDAAAPMRLNWADNARAAQLIPYHIENGMAMLEEYDNGVAAIQFVNGELLNEKEISVLVMPGEAAVFDMIVPNGPISRERAEKLAKINYEEHYLACRKYWREKLAAAAKVELPEKEIEKRINAGLLHLLLCTTGEQNGPLLTHVGPQYTPIGSESAPMILTYDWLGLPELAGRSIDYFFKCRQLENGYIRTYSNYENETGPAVWTAAEHYHITRDAEWLKRILPEIKISCEFLIRWRNENKTEECRAAGCYGLQKGKVDDPDDFFHSFYLNAGGYGGLKRMSDALVEIDPEYSAYLAKEAEEYRQDIIAAMHIAQAKAPAVPATGGEWMQHFPPWTETIGDPAYHAEGGEWVDHETIMYRVLCNPPIYTGLFGVVDCRSEEMTAMLIANQSPHTVNNAGFTQPYYLRHDYAHAIRGEVKHYLKMFYNLIASMQDRETYTFMEHFYSNPYKGHEEAWMMMQVRWMLFLEDGNTMHFLRCAPAAWFRTGSRIVLENVRSLYGKLNLKMTSSEGSIAFEYELERAPEKVTVRLPHPDGRKAYRCTGGTYDAENETVTLCGTSGKIELFF